MVDLFLSGGPVMYPLLACSNPNGRLDRSFGSPTITHDGVTVAKEIELEDKFENMGAQMVKEVATKTQDVAGDGTTTATILAQSIIHQGIKNVTAGANPMFIKRGISKATEAIVAEIHKRSKSIKTSEEIASVTASGPPIRMRLIKTPRRTASGASEARIVA